jgi:hypothetical protein
MSCTISTTKDNPSPADEQLARTTLRQSNVKIIKPTIKPSIKWKEMKYAHFQKPLNPKPLKSKQKFRTWKLKPQFLLE